MTVETGITGSKEWLSNTPNEGTSSMPNKLLHQTKQNLNFYFPMVSRDCHNSRLTIIISFYKRSGSVTTIQTKKHVYCHTYMYNSTYCLPIICTYILIASQYFNMYEPIYRATSDLCVHECAVQCIECVPYWLKTQSDIRWYSYNSIDTESLNEIHTFIRFSQTN